MSATVMAFYCYSHRSKGDSYLKKDSVGDEGKNRKNVAWDKQKKVKFQKLKTSVPFQGKGVTLGAQCQPHPEHRILNNRPGVDSKHC